VRPEKIREMHEGELRGKEKELQEQIFKLRFQKSIGQLDNGMKMREIRRDIARVKTVLRQKESQASGRAQAGSGR
jgi:large subunit ribosomal protein L29